MYGKCVGLQEMANNQQSGRLVKHNIIK